MRRICSSLLAAIILAGMITVAFGLPEKEFLTEREIQLIRENQQIDRRVKIYMDAAALRLRTAEERLLGKEPEEGDPFEFFTPEDLLHGYYRIIRSVMYSLDDVYSKPGHDDHLGGALKSLKSGTEKALEELAVLKKIAENQKKEQLWNLVNQAIDIANGAHEGAEYGLSKQSSPSKK